MSLRGWIKSRKENVCSARKCLTQKSAKTKQIAVNARHKTGVDRQKSARTRLMNRGADRGLRNSVYTQQVNPKSRVENL